MSINEKDRLAIERVKNKGFFVIERSFMFALLLLAAALIAVLLLIIIGG